MMSSPAQFPFDQEVVWQPSEPYLRQSRLKRFMDRHGLATLEELMARSTADPAWFWEAVFQDLGIEFYEPYRQVVDLSRGVEWPAWCVGGQLNIVHNCLDKWMGTPTQNRVAVRWEGEEGAVRLLTYRDLFREVNRLSTALRGAGLGKGDVIGLHMPMMLLTHVACGSSAAVGRRPWGVSLSTTPGRICESCLVISSSDRPERCASVLMMSGPSAEPSCPGDTGWFSPCPIQELIALLKPPFCNLSTNPPKPPSKPPSP